MLSKPFAASKSLGTSPIQDVPQNNFWKSVGGGHSKRKEGVRQLAWKKLDESFY